MVRNSQKAVVVGLLLSSLSVGVAAIAVGYIRRAHARFLADGPRAKKRPKKVWFGKVEGEKRGTDPEALIDPPIFEMDDYYWLRDDTRKNREILRHIKRENRYTDMKTRHLKGLQKELYKDLLLHLKETDEEYPYPWGDYFYLSKTFEGKAYEQIVRKSSMDEGAKETVLLDVNKLAEDQKLTFCDVGDWTVSPDHSIFAYSLDSTGYETYNAHFIDIETGEALPDVIEDMAGSVVWGNDNSVVYYLKMDDQHRPYQLWRHVMGRPCTEDVLMLEEKDERLWMNIGKTDSERFIVVKVGGKARNESRLIDLQGAKGPKQHAARALILVQERGEDHRYSVEHNGEHLYIISNKDGAINGKLVRTKVETPGMEHWADVFAYDPAVQFTSIFAFESFLVLWGRQDGFPQCWVYDLVTNSRHRVEHPEPVYGVWGGNHYIYASNTLRFEYSSPTQPRATIDYNMRTRERFTLKQTEVPNYDSSLYKCERLEATSHDGVKVPISLVYRKDLKKPFKGLVLYGYGSYGHSVDPHFASSRISLLDRGVGFAIGHIRGGGEMGREWYEKHGKYLTKKNTFLDFIACGEALCKAGYTSPDKLAIWGGSAGGLLMGACVNLRPDLFRAVVADVPFVDVLTTMADASIPLTVTEWEEWGNSNEKKYHQYMKEYSPMNNLQPADYPAILATGGLNDPRVAYWEPTKWVAKLREVKTDKNPLLLKIDLTSGHGGSSDRYKYLEEKAFAYAFILDQLGLAPEAVPLGPFRAALEAIGLL